MSLESVIARPTGTKDRITGTRCLETVEEKTQVMKLIQKK